MFLAYGGCPDDVSSCPEHIMKPIQVPCHAFATGKVFLQMVCRALDVRADMASSLCDPVVCVLPSPLLCQGFEEAQTFTITSSKSVNSF